MNLLRRNNTTYDPKENFNRILSGLLNGSRMFLRDPQNREAWFMNAELAQKWIMD